MKPTSWTGLHNRITRAPSEEIGAAAKNDAPGGDDTQEPQSNASSDASTPPAGDPPAAPDYSALPEQFKTDDGYDHDALKAHLEDLETFKAQTNERRGEVPESADDYELDPGEVDFGDLELPDNFAANFVSDETLKPLQSELQSFLHDIGAPAESGKTLMGMMMKYEAKLASDQFTATKAEWDKVENVESRLASLERVIKTKLPENEATALKATIKSADALRALERVLSPAGPKSTTSTPAGGVDHSLPAYERLVQIRAGQTIAG